MFIYWHEILMDWQLNQSIKSNALHSFCTIMWSQGHDCWEIDDALMASLMP